ncbi:hypothetical protein LTR66_007445 [Elasticomyces elasticus]|nr:hypothetical protein LTR66_007445 [Elasticomyces elasticus]KAK4988684.1 hypothetical protein LTR50_003763 [Elasticomyces elasticus]
MAVVQGTPQEHTDTDPKTGSSERMHQTKEHIAVGNGVHSHLGWITPPEDTPMTVSSGTLGMDTYSPSDVTHTTKPFIEGMQNYIALGCLRPDGCETLAASLPGWHEVVDVQSLQGLDSRLKSSLRKLWTERWIRLFASTLLPDKSPLVVRVYLLPADVGNSHHIDRHSKALVTALEDLLRQIDVSSATWQGYSAKYQNSISHFDIWATGEEGSLYYLFNNIPSPEPSPESVSNEYDQAALADLLDQKNSVIGLKTQLYPYQRRSAGLMLQRESSQQLMLDPRLERRIAPDGRAYYYGARDLTFLRESRWYPSCNGGILAETMGLGKTVICLALLLATRGHLPKIPALYAAPPRRVQVGSLTHMAIAAINRHSIPWKVHFDYVAKATGDQMSQCVSLLEANPPSYEIPSEPPRYNRNTVTPPPRKLVTASTTIIVVPRNLCSQWQSEIRKHTIENALRVLIMEDSKKALPASGELRTYDVILFSRTRFEQEVRDGADSQGRPRNQVTWSCPCPYYQGCRCVRGEEVYHSPLKELHFLRIIIDEGHFFASSSSQAAVVAEKLVKADHRWVISGTPAKDLFGVEVDTALINPDSGNQNTRHSMLQQRKDFSPMEDTKGAIRSLVSLAGHFLKVQPWHSNGDRSTDWDTHIYRHEDVRKKTYSGFSLALRRTLNSIVVKTRPEDVEKDIKLPHLSYQVVRLEPSFFDKITANLFNLVLTTNAITSERTDTDYIFHKNSAKARCELIANLRQSAFCWTGFAEADVYAALGNGKAYLSKEGTACTPEDRTLLIRSMTLAETALASPGWKALSRSREVGLFIENWPADSAEFWSFTPSPMLTGLTQLLEAQAFVNHRLTEADPTEGLSGAGIRALTVSKSMNYVRTNNDTASALKSLIQKGILASSINSEPAPKQRSQNLARAKSSSPKKRKRESARPGSANEARRNASTLSPCSTKDTLDDGIYYEKASRSRPRVQRVSLPSARTSLPTDSPLQSTSIIGTTSAKLSYLVSRILQFHSDEKILVFYDGDAVAYYIAQVLELLHIPHLIYARTLTPAQRSEHIVLFDQDDYFRVLIMDVKQAAFGLNLSSASRVFFVNPVCRPSVEAQAIKRAHRIGQTRPVVVETLVLKGTIEEGMIERAEHMTRSEHLDAKMLEDDGGIRDIIQKAAVIPIETGEGTGYRQISFLQTPQQLWGRPGWSSSMASSNNGLLDTVARRNKRARLSVTRGGDIDESSMSSGSPATPAPSAESSSSHLARPSSVWTGGNKEASVSSLDTPSTHAAPERGSLFGKELLPLSTREQFPLLATPSSAWYG